MASDRTPGIQEPIGAEYDALLDGIADLLSQARRQAARSVNRVLTSAYWSIGGRIVEHEQGGTARAAYGEGLLPRLSQDLTKRFGRGFSVDNLENMRLFYLAYPGGQISEAPSRKSVPDVGLEKSETVPRIFDGPAPPFPLSWSHYVLLLRRCPSPEGRSFYETEALRGGWSTRQLQRQIDSQFYERTALSRDKAALLLRGGVALPEDRVTPEQEIKDPYVLEFLGLRDEYSESDLEEALIHHLETFLLELGGDFAFVARQKRLRVGDEWYRVDLVFYHRGLRCLVLIDLKLGRLTHADAGQMHLYLNYAREHWTRDDENPPVGLILCAHKNDAIAHYALEGLANQVLAAEYRTALPDEKVLAEEIARVRQDLLHRGGDR